MDQADLIAYVNEKRYGVLSSIGPEGEPQSAYLAVVATAQGELVFNANSDSRKVLNLQRDPRIALVLGGPDHTTLQAQGTVDFPEGPERDRLVAVYIEALPRFSRSAVNPNITFMRIAIEWSKFTDFREKLA